MHIEHEEGNEFDDGGMAVLASEGRCDQTTSQGTCRVAVECRCQSESGECAGESCASRVKMLACWSRSWVVRGTTYLRPALSFYALSPLRVRGANVRYLTSSVALHLAAGVAAGDCNLRGPTRQGPRGRQVLWPKAALAIRARAGTQPCTRCGRGQHGNAVATHNLVPNRE